MLMTEHKEEQTQVCECCNYWVPVLIKVWCNEKEQKMQWWCPECVEEAR